MSRSLLGREAPFGGGRCRMSRRQLAQPPVHPRAERMLLAPMTSRSYDMQKTPGGIAARAGRWSARHKKTAIIGWLVFVLVALAAGHMTGTKEPTDAAQFDGESRTAQQMITDAGFSDAAGEMVLVQSPKLTAKDAAFKS